MKKTILLIVSAFALLPLQAQNEWPRGVNGSLHTAELAALRLPAPVDDICFLDGRLHLSSGGMLFGISVNGGRLGFPEIDTALTAIDAQMTYAARHTATGTLYYTKKDKKGDCFLYEYYEKKPGKFDTRRVKPYGFSYSIEHPVFSSDGRAMVFASDCPIGFGGRDLWYSEWRGGQWQYPQNLGHRINGEGDETMPAICGDFLVFSSSGRSDSYGGSDLYATRLVALEQTGDTVTMYPIGRSTVQSLEQPLCSSEADWGFTCDGSGAGWWLTGDSLSGTRLHSFSGRMDCIRVSGMVSDINGSVLDGATVVCKSADNRQSSVKSDDQGRFTFFVQPGEDYELTCSADDHFAFSQTLRFERSKEDRLYIAERYNIVLDAYAIGSVYTYADLFASPVATELTAAGRRQMDRIALFLLENPSLHLSVTSAYDLGDDPTFCRLLNNARIRTLTDYLKAKGIPLASIDTDVDSPHPASAQGNDTEPASAAAASSRTVFFTFTK